MTYAFALLRLNLHLWWHSHVAHSLEMALVRDDNHELDGITKPLVGSFDEEVVADSKRVFMGCWTCRRPYYRDRDVPLPLETRQQFRL